MAIYAQFDEDGPCLQIASNVGWTEFGDWVEKLDGYDRITKLWNEGNQEDIAGLRDELEHVLDVEPPENKDVESVAHEIVHAIDAAGAAEVLIVSAGVKNEIEEERPPKNGKQAKVSISQPIDIPPRMELNGNSHAE